MYNNGLNYDHYVKGSRQLKEHDNNIWADGFAIGVLCSFLVLIACKLLGVI